MNYYEIIRQADGGFAVTYGPAKNGDKAFPINSINGFTDRRSFIIDLINQGYK
jgi:hypothetical protein